MTQQVTLPDLGEGVIEAHISRWLKQEGDSVQVDEPLVEIETDKIITEVVAAASGTLLKIVTPAGQTASVGAPLAIIGGPDETPPANGSARQSGANSGPRPKISPLAKRLARQNKLDIQQISGSGLHGRITKKDVEALLEQRGHPAEPLPVAEPEPEPPAAPPTEAAAPESPPVSTLTPGDKLVPLTGVRRTIAEHMARSKQTSPHATTVFEIDFTAVMAHRREHKDDFARRGIHLTVTPYILRAVYRALRAHPAANSQWTPDGILLKGNINLGMAVAVPYGLIVPVIKNADLPNLAGLARQVNDLAQRARDNRLSPDEVRDGTFTVSNHGVSGSLFATPIINQPQSGILGFGKIEKRVVVITSQGQDMMVIRPLAFASFTFDHRILDGATADAFVAAVKRELESF